jgi:glycogen operon protein
VGSFIGDQWKEWNGKFRDDVRAYLKGDPGAIANLPKRLLASPDLYEHEHREAAQSVNFITCHDGFTLNDLVSYNQKHNLANGEDNRDGSDNNLSWNHGEEGPSAEPRVEELRERQIKNALALTLLSMGTPMLLMGDEVRQTQEGNNNAYCQDNELTWFDWDLAQRHTGLRRFTTELIRFRLHFTSGLLDEDKPLAQVLREARFTWHGAELDRPDWSPNARTLAVTISAADNSRQAHLLCNTGWDACDFALPALPRGKKWRRILDTNLAPPEDIFQPKQAPVIQSKRYLAAPWSVVLLAAA